MQSHPVRYLFRYGVPCPALSTLHAYLYILLHSPGDPTHGLTGTLRKSHMYLYADNAGTAGPELTHSGRYRGIWASRV